MTKAKRLLLITYYWPPAGGVAVLRWLQMTKHLAELGWDITVFHPQNAAYPSFDKQGLEKVSQKIKQISQPIIEPGKLYEQLNSNQKSNNTQVFRDNKGWFKQTALKLRANRFIPDARMLWIRPSVKFLTKRLRENHYDVVVTNGTPHSCHVIGLQLKKKFPNLNWVADFRDPWMEIDYFEDLPLSNKSRKKHEKLERDVLSTADLVTTVSPSWAKLFEEKGAKKTGVFTNGYEADLFKNQSKTTNTEEITISHVGTLDSDRNPTTLWKALKETTDLQVDLTGPIAQEVIQQTEGFPQVSINPQTVPHEVALKMMQKSDALLLLNNRKGAVKGRIPAKVFEYLALEKPIIYFGQLENDAADILKESGMAKFYSYEDEIDLSELKHWIKQPHVSNKEFSAQFSRKAIANEYSHFLIRTFGL